MPTYRIYFLSNGAQIEKGLDIDCRTDEAAVDHVNRLARHQGQAQLWCGCRSLGTFPGLLDSAVSSAVVVPQHGPMHRAERAPERFPSSRAALPDIAAFIHETTEAEHIPLLLSPPQAGSARSSGSLQDRRSGPATT